MPALPQAAHIAAAIFDMDGTLVDSENYSERAVVRLLGRYQLSPTALDGLDFHGITWQRAVDLLSQRYPTLRREGLAAQLQREFHRSFVEQPPPYIPGAEAAMGAARRHLRTAIVTSSNRETLAALIRRMAIGDELTATIAAEDVRRSKPDPECYLLAAEKLGCPPARCLVFEDSEAGLRAAKAAGMWTVVITAGAGTHTTDPTLVDLAVRDYAALPADFFAAMGQQAAPQLP